MVGEAAPPCRPVFYHLFFFLGFFFVCFFFVFPLSHTHTLIKFVADRFSPSPTMQLTSRKQHLLLQYVHTCFFFVQQYQRGARQKWFTPREKKTGNKKKRKKKKYKYLCPAVTLHKWKKDSHWIQKYHNFYISNCLCWLLFRNTLISRESLSAKRISVLNLLVFSFLITTCSSNCPTHSASLQIWPVLGGSAFLMNLLLFFFFTLQNYNSIHIFSSLNSCF